MDFIRAGEALIRSSQPLLPFLAPSVYRKAACTRASQISRHCRPHQWQCQASRSFASSASQRQQGAAARKDDAERDPFSDLLDAALDTHKGVPTAPTGRTSKFASSTAQRSNPPAGRQGRLTEIDDKSATEELEGLFDEADRSRPRPSPPSASAANRKSTSPLHDLLELGISSKLDPMGRTKPANTSPPAPYVPEPAPMKLNSSTGRTVRVQENRGMDVGRAFRSLEQQCARNSVKRDFMRQRFHERPGLKRKRLKSERWRKRFKEQFRETIRMVQKMKGQGW